MPGQSLGRYGSMRQRLPWVLEVNAVSLLECSSSGFYLVDRGLIPRWRGKDFWGSRMLPLTNIMFQSIRSASSKHPIRIELTTFFLYSLLGGWF